MAKQSTRFIDVTQSYLPVDPNAYFDTLSLIDKSDFPEERVEVVAYEGYNFLPTSYGYKSYFGTTAALDIESLGPQVDDVFVIQTQEFQNIAVALTPTGIYTKEADSSGEWTHAIALDEPPEGVSLNWTKCMIGNELFCYRATNETYAVFSPVERQVSQGEIEAGATPGTHPANQFYEVQPNFLNMAGQQGIFKAGSRLGFWDSANSIAVSSVDDFAQFTPNTKTGASNVIFNEIKGRITQIYALDDGFIIYATRSIVSVKRNTDSTMQWMPTVLVQDNGVAFPRECCPGENTATHYAYTAAGLFRIIADKAEPVAIPEVDFLKESKEPVFLKVLDNRYLFLEILDSEYVDGLVSFTVETIPASVQVYPPYNKYWNQQQAEAAYDSLFTLKDDALGLLDNYILDNDLVLRKEGTDITPVYEYNWHAYARAALASWPTAGWTGPSGVGREDFTFSEETEQNLWDIFGVGDVWLPMTAEFDPMLTTPYIPITSVAQSAMPIPTDGEDYIAKVIEYTDTYASKQRSARASVKLINPHEEDINMLPFITCRKTTIGAPGTISLSRNTQIYGEYTLGNFDFHYVEPADPTALTVFYEENSVDAHLVSFRPGATVTTTDSRVTVTRHPELDGTIGARIRIKPVPDDDFPAEIVRWNLFTEPYYAEVDSTSGDISCYVEITGYEYTGEDDETYTIPNSSLKLTNLTGGQSYVFTDSGSITYPPVSFLLQNGSIGPVRPTIPGALVYDTYLQKWGKMKGDYKLLVDWKPLNNSSGEVIPYEVFGMQGGIVDTEGRIRLFDMFPVDSYIRYGKMGHHREGFTKIDEVRVRFRTPCTGTLRTDSSLDGYGIELGFSRETPFENELQVTLYPNVSARWHTISLTGIFDIRYLEYRAHEMSNR